MYSHWPTNIRQQLILRININDTATVLLIFFSKNFAIGQF